MLSFLFLFSQKLRNYRTLTFYQMSSAKSTRDRFIRFLLLHLMASDLWMSMSIKWLTILTLAPEIFSLISGCTKMSNMSVDSATLSSAISSKYLSTKYVACCHSAVPPGGWWIVQGYTWAKTLELF